MKLLLLSTCGTSILSNETPPDVRGWLTDIANRRDLGGEEAARLDRHVQERREILQGADEATRRRLSAELNGIGAVLDREMPTQTQHVLVHTDAAVGEATAQLVEELLRERQDIVIKLTSGGLRTDDAASFREALADITRQLEEMDFAKLRKAGWTIVFNLTGGFKAINAYLQALGMLYADRCVFLFERSPALIEIPRLPVRLADIDEVRKYLHVFRRLSLGYPIRVDEAAGIPESLLLVNDGLVATSVWGDAVWQRARATLLAEQLLAPLSKKLSVKDPVGKAFNGLPSDRKVLVNQALDALAAHLDGIRPLPKSNTFKKLKGDPVPPSTHELYVWSDGAAWRLFGHYEGERFIADSLEKHL